MSSGNDFRGPWNEGVSAQLGETWQYIDDPIQYVITTNSLIDHNIKGSDRTEKQVSKLNKELGEMRSKEVNAAVPIGKQQWNDSLMGDGTSLANGVKAVKERSTKK
jgi:Mn-containing catalase